MNSPDLDQIKLHKRMLKASLCAAAPAVVPFVLLITTNSVSLLESTGLGRLGIAAAMILILFLAHLFWKGRWWAAIPALICAVGAAILFIYRIIRPLSAYFKANPVKDIGDVTEPLFLLSPAMVIIVISITLAYVIFKGIGLVRTLEQRPVSTILWGLCAVWALALAGDAWYQQSGWRSFDHPSALIVRLCAHEQRHLAEAREKLLKIGPPAVPELILAAGVEDPDLDCLRAESRVILKGLGAAAGQPLVNAARQGNRTALGLLREMDLKGAVKPLLEFYQDPTRESSEEFEAELKETIEALKPGAAKQ